MKHPLLIIGVIFLVITALAYSNFGYLVQSVKNQPRPKAQLSGELAEPGSRNNSYVQDQALAKKIHLPSGFAINYFASNVPGARSLAAGPTGVIFVGTKDLDRVYALVDADHDGQAEERVIVADKLKSPNGVAYQAGSLYVAEISRIIKFPNIDSTFRTKPQYQVVYDQLPKDTHHGWKYLSFGPDGKLYVPVGAPCNICDAGDPYAGLSRLNPDGSGWEIIARGIRNTVGFTWDQSGRLWFTDNGRDLLGDNLPADELNVITTSNPHFGYPYCHQGDVLDPQFVKNHTCDSYLPPAIKLGPHVAALGLKFYGPKILIAEHGSWNRTSPIGYRISQVDIDGTTANNYRVFADGWLDKSGNAWGRPVDILVMPDNSFLVSDDKAGAVYRIFPTTR